MLEFLKNLKKFKMLRKNVPIFRKILEIRDIPEIPEILEIWKSLKSLKCLNPWKSKGFF